MSERLQRSGPIFSPQGRCSGFIFQPISDRPGLPVFTGLGNMSVSAIQTGPDTLLTPNLIVGTSYGGVWQRRLAEMITSTVGFPVAKGWNIISLPYLVGDYRTVVNFPSASSAAFAYEGSYVVADTLKNGIGYWLKFDADQKIPLSGGAIIDDSIGITAGWNLIGSISSRLAVANITADSPGTIVSNFFGYTSGYYITDTIEPMQGYWVKSNRNGMLYLSSAAANRRANRITIVPTGDCRLRRRLEMQIGVRPRLSFFAQTKLSESVQSVDDDPVFDSLRRTGTPDDL